MEYLLYDILAIYGYIYSPSPRRFPSPLGHFFAMITASNSSPSPRVGGTIGWIRCVLLVTASLALAYLISAITFIIRWMHVWIRGPHFQPYISIFLTMQAVFLLRWVCRRHGEQLRFLSTVMYSMAAGYAAGLLAIAFYPLFEADSAQETIPTLQFPTIESAIALFWFPLRLLCWLFGGITGGILIFLSRRWKQQTGERAIESP